MQLLKVIAKWQEAEGNRTESKREQEREGEVAETERERQSTEIEMQTEKRECNAWKNLANKNIQNFRAIKATLERATCRTYRRTHTHAHSRTHSVNNPRPLGHPNPRPSAQRMHRASFLESVSHFMRVHTKFHSHATLAAGTLIVRRSLQHI